MSNEFKKLVAATKSDQWFRQDNCVFTLMHAQWRNGIEEKKNRLYASFQFDRECSAAEAEATAEFTAFMLNNAQNFVALIEAAKKLSEQWTGENNRDLVEALAPFAE